VIKPALLNTVRFFVIFLAMWLAIAAVDNFFTGRPLRLPFSDQPWLWVVFLVAGFFGSLSRERKS
jgi:hypothetical protein